MFGWKRKTVAAQPFVHKTVRLSMLQVFAYAYAAAEARGWPRGAIAAEIAWRTRWLEERRLPGLGVLVNHFAKHRNADPKALGQQCAIIRGAFFAEEADALVAKDPTRPHVIEGPEAAILLLPKVAQYAAQIGEPIRVSWVSDNQIQAQTVISPGGQMGHVGELQAILSASATGFARHGEPYPFPPAANAAFTDIPEPMVDGILGFIGPQIMGRVVKVLSLFQNDPATVALLHSQTRGERENFSLLGSEHKVAQGTLNYAVALESTNDRICSALSSYGWFEHDPGMFDAKLDGLVRGHRSTEAAKDAMPMILSILDQFPPVRH
jgi:hypothetical protein